MLISNLQNIKLTVHHYLPGSKVLLFGSRARKEETKDSDYDVMIITQQSFSPREKISWCSKISKALVKLLDAPVDVIINSKEETEIKRALPGHLVRWALKDAVVI